MRSECKGRDELSYKYILGFPHQLQGHDSTENLYVTASAQVARPLPISNTELLPPSTLPIVQGEIRLLSSVSSCARSIP